MCQHGLSKDIPWIFTNVKKVQIVWSMTFLCENTMPILFNIFINDLVMGLSTTNEYSSQWCPLTGLRGNGHKLKCRKFHFKLFHCGGGQILEQVAQIGHGVSIAGDIPNPTGYGPGKLALAGAALSGSFGLDYLQRYIPTSVNLWCCDVTYSSIVNTAPMTLAFYWADIWSICAALWTSDPFLRNYSLTNYSPNFTGAFLLTCNHLHWSLIPSCGFSIAPSI